MPATAGRNSLPARRLRGRTSPPDPANPRQELAPGPGKPTAGTRPRTRQTHGRNARPDPAKQRPELAPGPSKPTAGTRPRTQQTHGRNSPPDPANPRQELAPGPSKPTAGTRRRAGNPRGRRKPRSPGRSALSRGEAAQRGRDRRRRRARVRRTGDGPPDHQQVRPGPQRLLGGGRPRLVVGVSTGRAYPGRDQRDVRAHLGPDDGDLPR